jgi:lipopolysaccharide/colanic/teichoic acid biosynthesis glycosyltransferase
METFAVVTGEKSNKIIHDPAGISESIGYISVWQSVVKTMSDYFFSLISLLILSPVILLLISLIRISGKGPVIYTQDRIGKNGKPFVIYKFRSMIFEAENGSPMLSGLKEGRVTKLGRFMRKYRIDEIPNFINVLKGDMSLVGPRPERKFFIDLIVNKVPGYTAIQSVKPGITSWGQVKYGYASSVEEMAERFEYDRYYLEHRSLLFDFKIILLTIGTILRGKGV